MPDSRTPDLDEGVGAAIPGGAAISNDWVEDRRHANPNGW